MDFSRQLEEHLQAMQALHTDTTVERIIAEIVQCFRRGAKLLIFGNGGSAADAQHFAAELTNKFYRHRQPLAAIALTTDTSFLTAHGNDYDFASIFERQIEALGKRGDIAIGLTTSGHSPNVIKGIEKAKECGLTTIVLTGKTGGKINNLADITFHAQTDSTPRIQEVHEFAYHIISEYVEEEMTRDEGRSLP